MTADHSSKATCDFNGCSVHQYVEYQVPFRQALIELGWWVGKTPDPLLFCPKHYRQDPPMPAIGIYPHCEHCRPCLSETANSLHFRPCRYDIKCAGASPA